MTCIVAIAEGRKVYMGGDSVCSTGYIQHKLADPKVFLKSGMVMGGCGVLRQQDIIKNHCQITRRKKGQGVDRYISTVVMPALRKAFKAQGCMEILNSKETHGDACLLIGCGGKIFTAHSGISFIRTNKSYAAIGSGQEVALGSLWQTEDNLDHNIGSRLECALLAASEFSCGVGPPFHFAQA